MQQNQLNQIFTILGKAKNIKLSGLCSWVQSEFEDYCDPESMSRGKIFKTQTYDNGDYYWGELNNGMRKWRRVLFLCQNRGS